MWASLARDYLSIISTSISSKHAFSAAAQTVTKCHNRLKGDIVEAIQVLRMLYNRDLIFREPGPSSATELLLEEEDETGTEAEITVKENLDWILDLSDDSDEEDSE